MKDLDLQKLRVQTWYRHLLQRAIGSEVDRCADIAARSTTSENNSLLPDLNAALQKWLNDQVVQNMHRLTSEETEVAQRLCRSRYDEGKSTPTAMTVGVFEILLPGSAALYDQGPGELPVWQVLDGDLNICKAYVEGVLSPPLGWWEKDFNEIVQEVFDSLIAPIYRVDINAIPTLSAPQRDVHPVWLSFINSRYAATFSEEEANCLPDAFTLDDSIVLAIALANLAADRDNGPQLQLEWLLVGLCWGVIAQHMDEPIQEYVLKSLVKRGKAMDSTLKKMGVRVATFEERWPGGLTP